MSFQSKRYELLIADETYNNEIKSIFALTSFPGNISINFSRGENPLESFKNDGDKVFSLIIKDKEYNKIVAFGCCVIQKLFINGTPKNAGYLTGLKILPEYQKRIRIIPLAYKFLYDNLSSKVDIFYTTILSENVNAQQILEKKRRSMPNYHHIDNYTVHCFKCTKSKMDCVKQGDVEGLSEFYNKYLYKCNFNPVNIHLEGIRDDNFFTVRDNNKNIVMSCAVWNQQGYKKYIINSYNGIFRFLRYFPTNLLGFPKFPEVNVNINYGTVALFCVDDRYKHKIADFLNTVSYMANQYSFIIYGILQKHNFYKYVEELKSVKYNSKLYTVNWEKEYPLDGRPIQLEVGLL